MNKDTPLEKMEFPVFKTKSPPAGEAGLPGLPRFNLADPKERAKYFQFKAGREIEKIRQYLKKNTFLAILLGKKNSGKGTYSKLFMEAVGGERVVHLSVGDIVRSVDKEVADPKKLKELTAFLKEQYRGWLPLEKMIEAQRQRSTQRLLPTEFILALLKREIARQERKALLIDGFPRDLDQISYSLFFRDLAGYRDDPDFFVLIDIPEALIDERIKGRVICPRCQTSRGLRLFPTKEVGYDPEEKEFYLICDNPQCQGARMRRKEGDELGLAPIRKRLQTDEDLIRQAFSLHGIPKILLRNAVPVKQAQEMVDDYEITPEYVYSWDEKEKRVEREEKPWIFKDDQGRDSVSLLAPPVVVSLIKQLADLLSTALAVSEHFTLNS